MGSVAVKVVCTCVSMHMSVLECVSSCVMGYEGESGSINTPQISGAVKVRLLCAVPACLTSPSYYSAKHVLWPTLCDRIKNKFYYLEIILFLLLVNLFNKILIFTGDSTPILSKALVTVSIQSDSCIYHKIPENRSQRNQWQDLMMTLQTDLRMKKGGGFYRSKDWWELSNSKLWTMV